MPPPAHDVSHSSTHSDPSANAPRAPNGPDISSGTSRPHGQRLRGKTETSNSSRCFIEDDADADADAAADVDADAGADASNSVRNSEERLPAEDDSPTGTADAAQHESRHASQGDGAGAAAGGGDRRGRKGEGKRSSASQVADAINDWDPFFGSDDLDIEK